MLAGCGSTIRPFASSSDLRYHVPLKVEAASETTHLQRRTIFDYNVEGLWSRPIARGLLLALLTAEGSHNRKAPAAGINRSH